MSAEMLRNKVVQKNTTNEGQEYSKNSKPQFERAKNLVDPLIQEIVEKHKNPKCIRVLDVGCGAGDIAGYFASFGMQVDGFDVAGEMIEEAEKKYIDVPNLKFRVADAADFSFPYKFDLIISTSTLQWVSDEKIQQAFTLMGRHLKPGGKLVFLLPTYDFPHIVIKDLVAFSEKWKMKFQNFNEPQSLHRTADDYKSMLEKADLGDIAIQEKKSTHEYTTDGFIGFTKQWCGCFHYLKDQVLDEEFINDVREAFEKQNINEGKVVFEQISLIGVAHKPELKLASLMTLGITNSNADAIINNSIDYGTSENNMK